MGNFRLKLNSAGVRKLLRSSEMEEVCRQQAETIRGRCGEGYEVTTRTGKNRVNASVYAKTVAARQDNRRNNTILKATQ